MIEMIAQVAAGEGAVYAVGGGAATVIVGLLIKQGFKIVVGKENGNGNGKSAGGSGSHGKPLMLQACPAHEEFSQKLDERHESIKEKLAIIMGNQESQQVLFLSAINEVKTSITVLHRRIDEVIKGQRNGNGHQG